jgi:SOS response regulatory protein OraA/RecX
MGRRRSPALATSGRDPALTYSTALKVLSARELSSRQLADRLLKRGFPLEAVRAALARLSESGALDDRRVALAVARRGLKIKHQGRIRVLGELNAIGISRDVARAAVAEVFAEVDEGALLERALARRATPGPVDAKGLRRLHAYLIRQGFAPEAVNAALRKKIGRSPDDPD